SASSPRCGASNGGLRGNPSRIIEREPTTRHDHVQDRHVMSQMPCNRCGFPVMMRWLNAGGDLSRPNSIDQCATRALIRSEQPPRQSKLYSITSTARAIREAGKSRPSAFAVFKLITRSYLVGA